MLQYLLGEIPLGVDEQSLVLFVDTSGLNEGVHTESSTIREQFALGQNYPNPFDPVSVINYTIPIKSRMSLKIFNLLGQEVKTLFDGIQMPGYHSSSWNAAEAAT